MYLPASPQSLTNIDKNCVFLGKHHYHTQSKQEPELFIYNNYCCEGNFTICHMTPVSWGGGDFQTHGPNHQGSDRNEAPF